jgi:hypothetical protein
MLISEDYRDQQKTLHETTVYGTASAQYAPQVAKLIEQFQVSELLDYGAGSRLTLIKTIGEKRLCQRKFRYIPYEPAVDKFSDTPEPAEMVVCLDVLEHIEPEYLDNVLDDLKRVTARIGFFTVSCEPAVKTLPDGRNAHLIQEPPQWWLPRITDRFDLHTFQKVPGGFCVLVAPYAPAAQ